MRRIPTILPLVVAFVLPLGAQDVPPVYEALTGSWTGVLEYRDYAEPASSTKRVKLPTWLSIELAGNDLRFVYVYDDGPGKTVKETSLIRMEPATSAYTVRDVAGKLESTYSITGLDQLRSGRGTLTLLARERKTVWL